MAFLKKAGATVSIESRYLEGKARGFKHGPEVGVQLEVFSIQQKEIKTLKKVFKAEYSSYKKIAENTEKCCKELLYFITEGRQNPKLGTIYGAVADYHTKTGEIRTNGVLSLGSVLEEWKLLTKSDLKSINTKLEQANKFLVTRQYHESNKEMTQSKDFDQKYTTTIKEFVKLMQELREKKESLIPQFVLRSLQAEAIFFKGILVQAELCESALRTIGPCPPIKFEGFRLAPKDPYPMSAQEKEKLSTQTASKNPYDSPTASVNPYAQVQQTTVTTTYHQQPLPPVLPPVSAYPKCLFINLMRLKLMNSHLTLVTC